MWQLQSLHAAHVEVRPQQLAGSMGRAGSRPSSPKRTQEAEQAPTARAGAPTWEWVDEIGVLRAPKALALPIGGHCHLQAGRVGRVSWQERKRAGRCRAGGGDGAGLGWLAVWQRLLLSGLERGLEVAAPCAQSALQLQCTPQRGCARARLGGGQSSLVCSWHQAPHERLPAASCWCRNRRPQSPWALPLAGQTTGSASCRHSS